jgi:hypothetical protein
MSAQLGGGEESLQNRAASEDVGVIVSALTRAVEIEHNGIGFAGVIVLGNVHTVGKRGSCRGLENGSNAVFGSVETLFYLIVA